MDEQTFKERWKSLKRIKYFKKAQEQRKIHEQKAVENREKMEAKKKAKFTKVGKTIMMKTVFHTEKKVKKVIRRASNLEAQEFLNEASL